LKPKLAGECWRKAPHFLIGGVPWKKYELILRAAAEIFARQLPPSGTADLTFLTISSFSSQLRWLCSASPSLAANFF